MAKLVDYERYLKDRLELAKRGDLQPAMSKTAFENAYKLHRNQWARNESGKIKKDESGEKIKQANPYRTLLSKEYEMSIKQAKARAVAIEKIEGVKKTIKDVRSHNYDRKAFNDYVKKLSPRERGILFGGKYE